ncbi:fibronectin type III domain-containing protein [Aquisalimonas sp.]|uniref:fibronectin type III domain-containing protein n=1 Tax=Aquisalimonas sp. TaxID=1872621 RepID=UPI0025BC6E18|nr:fibronectin type III domain-containing protein [Aquisalimonas sp.]
MTLDGPTRSGLRRPSGDALTAVLRGLDGRLDRLERTRRTSFAAIENGGRLVIRDGGELRVGDGGPVLSIDPPDDVADLTLDTGLTDRHAYVDATWTAPTTGEPPAGYDVTVAVAGVGTIRTETETDLEHRIEPVPGGAEVTITVRARSLAGARSAGTSATITTPEVPGEGGATEPPTDAPDLTVGAGLETLIASWSRLVDAAGYDLEVTPDGEAAEVTDVVANVVSVPVDPGTYHVRVRGTNAAGPGPWSDPVTVTVHPLEVDGRDFTADPIEDGELADDAVRWRHIQAGTIDTDLINVSGLNAAVIAFGEMSGARIDVGTLEGDRIIAGTLDAGALTTSTLDAATITLGAGGILRAGRTASPFHYLTLGETGLAFYRNGSAPYTGGDPVLDLDVATGLASLTNATITSTDGTRRVDVLDGAVQIVRGDVTVGRVSGETRNVGGDPDASPTFALETPYVGGWNGPAIRFDPPGHRLDLVAWNGVRVSDELHVSGDLRTSSRLIAADGITTNYDLDIRLDGFAGDYGGIASNLLNSFQTRRVILGWVSGTSALNIHLGTFADNVEIRSETTAMSGLTAFNSSWRSHLKSVRGSNTVDWTVTTNYGGSADVQVNGSQVFTAGSTGGAIRLAGSIIVMDWDANGWVTVNNRIGAGSTSGSFNDSTQRAVLNSGFLLAYRAGNPAGYFQRSNSGNLLEFRRGTTNNLVGRVRVLVSSTVYETSSDPRLKTDVRPIDRALERVLALEPVSYRWLHADPDDPDDDDGRQRPRGASRNRGVGKAARDRGVDLGPGSGREDGLLAPDAEPVVPYAVSGSPDAVLDGGEPDPMAVDYGRLTPLLVAAIHELTRRLEALEDGKPHRGERR